MIEQIGASVIVLLFIFALPPLCALCILPGIVLYFFLLSMSAPFSFLGLVLVVSASASIPLVWFLIGAVLERVLTPYEHRGAYYSAWLPCIALAMASPEFLTADTMYGLANVYLWHEPEVFLSLFLYLSSMVVKWGVLVGGAYSLVVFMFGMLSHLASVSLVARLDSCSRKPLSVYAGLLVPLSLLLLAISCQYVSQQFLLDLLQPINQR